MNILIIRFSSIGDIVLTTPIVRAIKLKYPNSNLMYLTKSSMKDAISDNIYIDEYLFLESNNFEILIERLKSQKIDLIIDLHKNIRTTKIKLAIKGAKYFSFNKLNFKKWLSVQLSSSAVLPKHLSIVDRYFKGLEELDLNNDGNGLDFYFPPNFKISFSLPENYFILSPFTAHFTKSIPLELLEQIVYNSQLIFILIGGNTDYDTARALENKFPHLIMNLVGKLSIKESAFLIKNALGVVTADTGMMHIATAFQKPIYSIWGNTIPEFGFEPYFGNSNKLSNHYSFINQVHLICRPCSKIGFAKCPKGHFKCMLNQDISNLSEWLEKIPNSEKAKFN